VRLARLAAGRRPPHPSRRERRPRGRARFDLDGYVDRLEARYRSLAAELTGQPAQ
jgi:hypothetical protein